MSDITASIVRKIDRLDHPDARLQDEILREFSRRENEARPVILANLPLVSPRVRRALLRWLAQDPHESATLPLMRLVFDLAEKIEQRIARTLAMRILVQRATATGSPEERGRLRAFGEDMCGDAEPEIRAMAAELLAYVGNTDSVIYLEALRSDPEQDVREAGERAITILNEAPEDGDQRPVVVSQMVVQLEQSAGPRRRQLVRRWRRHPRSAEIAVELLRRRRGVETESLQVLLNAPHQEARPFLAPIILRDPGSDTASLALRLLAELGRPEDVKADEVEAVRRSYYSDAPLSRAAAVAAIGALGLRGFFDELLRWTESQDLAMAVEAARSLSVMAGPSDEERLEELRLALETNERRRRVDSSQEDRVLINAYLLSAIRAVVRPDMVGADRICRTVLALLASGAREPSLRVTSIQVLLAATPDEGLGRHRRWDESQVETLVALLAGGDRGVIRRVAKLLRRGAPTNCDALTRGAAAIWRSGFVDTAEVVVPLLVHADTDRARELLVEVAASDDPEGARAARGALREHRNSQEIIDADYVPRDDDEE